MVTFDYVNVTGKVKAAEFEGKGSEITDLNGEKITTGIIDDARIPQNITRESRFDPDPNKGHNHMGAQVGDGPKISHSNLGDMLEVDPKSTDANATKHISDALAKGWQDHINITSGNPHGTNAMSVGALPNVGGTINGSLQVNGNIGTTGTVNGVDISIFKSELDKHISKYFEFTGLNQQNVNVGTSWTKLITGTHSFTKNYNDTKIEVYVNSRFLGGTFIDSLGIYFQVRIDNNITPNFGGYGAITASNTIDFLSIYAVFQNLTAGTHVVSLWSQTSRGSSSSVLADPGGWGGKIIVKESW